MALTPAQLVTLKAAIIADAVLNFQPMTSGGVGTDVLTITTS